MDSATRSLQILLLLFSMTGQAIAQYDVSALVKKLQSPRAEERLAAAAEVASLGPKAQDAIPAMIEALKCERMDILFVSPQVAASRKTITDSIVFIGAGAIPQLEAALDHDNGLVRVWSALALQQIDSDRTQRVVPILIAALNAGGEVAADAAIALENIGEPAADAIEPLIEALANDSLEVRCNAAYAIASVAKGPKASALVKALHHENPLVCIGAGFALQKVNPNSLDSVLDVVKEGVRHESPVVRLQSVWAIGQMGPAAAPAVPDAVNAMDKLAPDPRAYFFGGPPGRYTVDPSLALVATGKMAVDPLVGALSHDLVRVRVMAAIALLSIDPSHFPKVAPILKAGMNDNDQFTSSMATQLWTQYTLSQERDLSVLVQALVDHRGMGPSPVGFLLAQRGSAAVEPLMKVLKAGDGRAARAAIRGLQQIGSPAIPPLKDAMQSEDTQIRMFAITALAGMRQPPRESLIAALDDDSYPVRRVAKYALKALAANAESRRAE